MQCAAWDRAEGYQWQKSDLFKQVRYVEVHGTSLSWTAPTVWPKDLRWVQEKLGITRGYPRFILVSGDQILLHQIGRRSWDESVLPFIKQRLAQRTAQ